MKQALQRAQHSVYSLHFHLVLVTKYRRKCLTANSLRLVKVISCDVLNRWGGDLLEFNGEADHVHLLLTLPPNAEPSRVVGSLKTQTSQAVRAEHREHLRRFYWKPVLWSASYCLITFGGAPLSVIRQYIEQQNRPL